MIYKFDAIVLKKIQTKKKMRDVEVHTHMWHPFNGIVYVIRNYFLLFLKGKDYLEVALFFFLLSHGNKTKTSSGVGA